MQFEDARAYKKDVRRLYKSAFPKNECAPISYLFFKTRKKNNSFFAITEKGEFIGLAYTIKSNTLLYVFYLAVREDKRGLGYGRKILEEIKRLYPAHTITLAIEDTEQTDADNFAERLKRLGFYQKNGFLQLGFRINEAGVIYELLGTDTSVTKAEFLLLMQNYFGKFLFKIIYKL